MATKIAGLPIQKEWAVVGVKEGDVEDNPNGPGQLQKFYVDFDGAPDVYWRRKLPATVEVGQTYFGTISEGKHGPIFKKENPNQGGGGSPAGGGGAATGSAGGRSWQPESQYDPEKTARIGRAHAQGMAIEVCKAMGVFDGKSAEQVMSKLSSWTDWFQGDVDKAGEKAAQGAGSAGRTAASPGGQVAASDGSGSAPAQASEGDGDGEDPQWVLKVCEDAGLSSYPAGKLANFIGRLNAEQQKRAVGGLSDIDTQGETLTKLKSSYQQTEGEPLPESDPQEDDIPF